MKKRLCAECSTSLDWNVYNYSVDYFGVPLCRKHQDWVRDMEEQSTYEAIALYFALRKRGVPARLEQFDGYKTIDIAIPEAKVNIEVDGAQHNFSPRQAFADLQRTYYSFKKGYVTLRIPNCLTNDKTLDETADYITEILEISRERSDWGRYKKNRFS